MNIEMPQRYCPITGYPLNLKPLTLWESPFKKPKRGGNRTDKDRRKNKIQKESRRKNR